jgi:hypothetical protein
MPHKACAMAILFLAAGPIDLPVNTSVVHDGISP